MKSVRQVTDFLTTAATSSAYLYCELAVSAFQLVPEIREWASAKSDAHPWSAVRDSLVPDPGAVVLQTHSPQSL